MDDLNLPISREAYVEGLRTELRQSNDKAHKAAITAELDRVTKRTAVAPKKETR
jgi:hypothetical protein